MGKSSDSKPTLLGRVTEKFMSLDMYGESLTFTINGSNTYPSIYGALISLAIFALVLPYGAHKFKTMWNFDDTTY